MASAINQQQSVDGVGQSVTQQAISEEESKPTSTGNVDDKPSHEAAPRETYHQYYVSSEPAIHYHKSRDYDSRLTAKLYLSNTVTGNGGFSALSSNIHYDLFDNPNAGTDGQGKSNYTDKTGEKGDIGEKGEKGDKTGTGGGDQWFNVTDPSDQTGGSGDGNQLPGLMPPGYPLLFTTTETVHHHQPVRFGLSLRYRVNDRWSLESGLTYSLLTADITTTIGGSVMQTKQRLNYLGLPVVLSCQLWGGRHFGVYASAGGMVEKMITGSRTTGSSSEHVTIAPLQLSVNGAVGVEYRLTNMFSIYAEPGIGYAFDNGSTIPTFYQDKPLNFSICLGLRLGFRQ